jgi:hypothetical protein
MASSDPQPNQKTEEEQNAINLPSRLPPPTGNLVYDSVQVSSKLVTVYSNAGFITLRAR